MSNLIMPLAKDGQDEDQEAFLPKVSEDGSITESEPRKAVPAWRRYTRLALEVVMACVIVLLLVRPLPSGKEPRRSPVPTCKPSTCHSSIHNWGIMIAKMWLIKFQQRHTLSSKTQSTYMRTCFPAKKRPFIRYTIGLN